MFDIKVLIRESGAVDTYTAGAVAVEEVAALDHEGVDGAVDYAAFVPEGFSVGFVFASTELAKVFGGSTS